MTTTLHPEQRQQLATLLAYCREMGGVDFYRSKQDAEAITAVTSILPPEFKTPPNAALEPVLSEPSSSMPRNPNLQSLPPLIDFSSPSIPSQDRAAALRAIQEEIGDCTRCPLAFEGRHKIVFGDGDPNAELLFVGEGPGADEDMQGVPFVGRGGQLLNNMITAMGLRRDQVYIANIVKCRPPQNRVPEPEEAHTCTPFLFQQIDVVHPEVVVALGATAALYLMGVKSPLSALRGRVHMCRGRKLIVTYHPAYLLRDPRQKKEAWHDLQLAMGELGLTAPPLKAG